MSEENQLDRLNLWLMRAWVFFIALLILAVGISLILEEVT